MFIVSSISGGTGSGTVLDVAHAVRIVLAGIGQNHEGVCGILTHGTGRRPDAKDLAVANAYACLSELHHLSCRRSGDTGRHPGKQAGQMPTLGENVGPFEEAYLIHSGDNLGGPDFEAAADVLAEYLYLDMATAAGTFFDKCREPSPAQDDSQNAEMKLRTFGLSQVGCSQTAIPSTATSLLCRSVVQRWCGRAEAGSKPENTEQLQLELDSFVEQLHAGVQKKIGGDADAYLQSCLDPEFADSSNSVAEEGDADERQALQVAEVLRKIDAAFGSHTKHNDLPDKPEGLLQRLLGTHVKAVASQRGVELGDWIFEFADTSAAGLDGAQRAAEWATERVRSLKTEADERLAQLRLNLAQMESAFWDTENGAAEQRKGWFGTILTGKQMTEFNERWAGYFYSRLDHFVLQATGKLLRLLEGQLATTVEQLRVFRRELNLLVDDVAEVPAADAPDDDTSSDPLGDLYWSVGESLRGRIPELAADLDRQFQEGLFVKHGRLRGMVEKGVQLRGLLGQALLGSARASILAALNKIDIAELLLSPDQQQPETESPLTALIEAAKPSLLACGGSQRPVLICPQGSYDNPVREAIESHLNEELSVVHDSDGDLIFCYEAEHLSLVSAAAGLIDYRRDYADIAARLHARVDINWTPLPQVE